MAKYNLVEQRFGRLLVIKEAEIRRTWNKRQWTCLCDCGKTKNINTCHLISGLVQSCGCLHKEIVSKIKFIHGHAINHTAEYRAWSGMKSRCYDTNVKCFQNWGGRGIKVCDRWLNSFENFFADMGKKPSSEYSLDRFPDVNGNYEPSNCRWGTDEQQRRGKRNNKWYEHDNRKMILEDWARDLNTSPETIKAYADKQGTAFSEQFEKLKSIGELNKQRGFIWNRKKKTVKQSNR